MYLLRLMCDPCRGASPYLFRIMHGEQWRAVMYVGYGSCSCCPRQLVPHTPVGAHNVTMTCEHLWQHRVGTLYYIRVCITSAWLHARVARLLTLDEQCKRLEYFRTGTQETDIIKLISCYSDNLSYWILDHAVPTVLQLHHCKREKFIWISTFLVELLTKRNVDLYLIFSHTIFIFDTIGGVWIFPKFYFFWFLFYLNSFVRILIRKNKN